MNISYTACFFTLKLIKVELLHKSLRICCVGGNCLNFFVVKTYHIYLYTIYAVKKIAVIEYFDELLAQNTEI